MARIRSLKPEFWADEDLATYTGRDTRLMYMGLWNLADEHARLRGDPRYIKGQIFAYDDDITPAIIRGFLAELAVIGKVVRYRVNGSQYLFLPKLSAHQRLEPDKTPSRFPGPEDADPEPDPEPPQRGRSENFPEESAQNPDYSARDETDTHEGVRQAADLGPSAQSESGPEKSAQIPEKSAQKRTVDQLRSVDGPETTPEQHEPENADLSEKISEESALAYARFGVMEHVAGGFSQGAGIPPSAGAPSLTLVPDLDDTPPIEGELLDADAGAVVVAEPNAGEILGAWIDYLAASSVTLTPSLKARYGKTIKASLSAGFTADEIKRALAKMLADGVSGRPNYLEARVVEARRTGRDARRLTPGERSVAKLSGPGDVDLLGHFFGAERAS